MQIFGIFLAVVVVGVVLFNGVVMLFSPSRWFSLPGWLRAQGSFNKNMLESRSETFWVRITGLLITAGTGYMFVSLLWPVIIPLMRR
jgi:hypothetical protein